MKKTDINPDLKNILKHNLFYVAPDNIAGGKASITGDDVHYLRDVLRKNEKEALQFTDGRGFLYEASISYRGRSELKLEIVKSRSFDEPDNATLLAFVPLKGSRNEFIFEKATELGIRDFLIFFSKNAVVDRISENRLLRFKAVIKQAMLQSRRLFLPSINVHKNTDSVIREFKQYDRKFVLHVDGVKAPAVQEGRNLILVGPEGGFEPGEIESFLNGGAELIALGEHRLRSETAAIAAAAKLIP